MTDFDDDDLMTDDALLEAIDALHEEGDEDVEELLSRSSVESVEEVLEMMNENRIISWEEAERILSDANTGPIKCSLPPQTRPSEPDNDTDVEQCIRKLQANDPNLTQINLNNMKRIAVPQIRRIIEALRDNGFLEKLSLANMGLYDHDIASLIDVLEINETLRSVNLETNYLSGTFFSKLFDAALKNQTLEEVKAVNQGLSFSTDAEREIINSVFQNRGLTKVSINLRLPEGRHKIDQAMLRNQEIRRVLRRQMAEEQRRIEAEKAKKPEPVVQPPKKAAPKPSPAPPPPEKKEPPKVYQLKKPSKELPKPEPPKEEEEAPPPESPKKKVVKKKKLPEITINTDVHIIKDTSNDSLRTERKIPEKRKVEPEKVKKKIMTDAFKKLAEKASTRPIKSRTDFDAISKSFLSKIPEEKPIDGIKSIENGSMRRIRPKERDVISSRGMRPKEEMHNPVEGPANGPVKENDKVPSGVDGKVNGEVVNGNAENGPTTEEPIKKRKKIIKKVPKKKPSEENGDTPDHQPQSFNIVHGVIIPDESKLNGESKRTRPSNEKIPKLKSAFESK